MVAIAPSLAPGDLVGGKYSIRRLIGSGGMSVVYEALHVRLDQRVALKILLPELAELGEGLVRFEREARAAVQLLSSHAARIFDVDALDDGTPYIVMEFLEGRDLAAELTARGPLPIAEAVDYLMQACDAMAEAHRAGTVHRDLKPSNLFLATNGGHPTIKVLDFGISKVADDRLARRVTTTQTSLGTALYMSPEQVRSAKHVDARTDVWALGVVLYELLTASLPFAGETTTAVAASIVADDPQRLRLLRSEVPSDLECVVMRALEKDRDRRFRNAGELATALTPFVRGVDNRESAHSPRTLVSAGIDERPNDPVLAPGFNIGIDGSLAPAAKPDCPPAFRRARWSDRNLLVLGGCAIFTLVALGVLVASKMTKSAVATSPNSLWEIPAMVSTNTVLLEAQHPPPAPTPSTAPANVVPSEATASSAVRSNIDKVTKPRSEVNRTAAGKLTVPSGKTLPTSGTTFASPKPATKSTVDLPDNPG